MKNLGSLLFILLLLFGCASTKTTSNDGTLTFRYTTVGILKGYDHTSKLIVYEGQNIIGESVAKKESEGNSITISLPNGIHNIRAVLNSKYEDKWEEHLIANEYSLDCLFDQPVEINGKKVITLVFDIKNEKTIVK